MRHDRVQPVTTRSRPDTTPPQSLMYCTAGPMQEKRPAQTQAPQPLSQTGATARRATNTDSQPKPQSVVHHVLWCGAELLVTLDDLVDGIQKVLFCHCLAARTDGIHACLCAHAADVCARAVGAQPRQKLKANVTLARHRACVDLQQETTQTHTDTQQAGDDSAQVGCLVLLPLLLHERSRPH